MRDTTATANVLQYGVGRCVTVRRLQMCDSTRTANV